MNDVGLVISDRATATVVAGRAPNLYCAGQVPAYRGAQPIAAAGLAGGLTRLVSLPQPFPSLRNQTTMPFFFGCRGYRRFGLALWSILLAGAAVGSACAAMPKVADGFKIRLVAAVPAVQYPHGSRPRPTVRYSSAGRWIRVGPADGRSLNLICDGEPVVFATVVRIAAWYGGRHISEHASTIRIATATARQGARLFTAWRGPNPTISTIYRLG